MASVYGTSSGTSPCHRVVNAFLEIKHSPRKGLGMFATKAIARGVCVIAETPVCVIRKDSNRINHMDVQNAYLRSSPDVHNSFDSLHEGSRSFPTKQMRIWMANAFAYEDSDTDATCIFLLQSRINHSCIPNCAWNWNREAGMAEVYSLAPLLQGEEVTICYEALYNYMTAAQRVPILQYKYGFCCTCKACLPDTAFQQVSNMRRQLISGLYHTLIGCEAPAFSKIALSVVGKTSTSLLLFSMKPVAFSKRLERSEEPFHWFLLAKLLEAEGLVGIPAGDAYDRAALTLSEWLEDSAIEVHAADLSNMRKWATASIDNMSLYNHENHVQGANEMWKNVYERLKTKGGALIEA